MQTAIFPVLFSVGEFWWHLLFCNCLHSSYHWHSPKPQLVWIKVPFFLVSVLLRRVFLSAALVMERPYGGAASHPHLHAEKRGLCLEDGLLVLLQPLALAQIVQQAAVSVCLGGWFSFVLKFHEALITFPHNFPAKTPLPLTLKKWIYKQKSEKWMQLSWTSLLTRTIMS